MIERRNQLSCFGEQHTIAENVARHVTAANCRERLCLDINIHFTEIAFDGFPATACRDAHLLVVISSRAAGCERIAEPEIVVLRNAVGDI